MQNQEQHLIIYGQLNAAKITLAAARTRADVEAGNETLAKAIANVEAHLRTLVSELCRALDL